MSPASINFVESSLLLKFTLAMQTHCQSYNPEIVTRWKSTEVSSKLMEEAQNEKLSTSMPEIYVEIEIENCPEVNEIKVI